LHVFSGLALEAAMRYLAPPGFAGGFFAGCGFFAGLETPMLIRK